MKNKKDEAGVCPHCGREDVDYGVLEPENGQAYYKGECNDCGTTFKEWYTLNYVEKTDINIPEEEQDNEKGVRN